MAFIYDLTDTWNAGGTTFSAIKMNVTDTASAAASKLVTLQVGGSERFGVDKTGIASFAGVVRGPAGTTSAPAFSFTTNTNTGMWSPSSDAIAFSTAGSERLRINSSGNVGIGTSSPAQRLHVATTAAPSGTTQSFLRATADVGFGADFGGGIIQGVGPIATISTVSSGTATERMRIDSSGNVGIGTSSPTQRLHVRQDQNGTTAALIQNRNGTGSPVAAVQFISGGFDLSDNRYAMIASDGGSNTTLQFWTGQGATPTEKMRIDSSGNVGIGLTGPQLPLSIGKGGGAPPATSGSTQSSGGIARIGSSGAATLDVGTLSSGSAWLQATNVTNLASNFDMLLNPNGGNVGIGVTVPVDKLQVEGNLYFGTSNRVVYTGGAGNLTLQTSTGVLAFNTGGSVERMRIDNAGNVGVGVTPGAWNTGARVIQAGGYASFGLARGGTSDALMSWNALVTGAGSSSGTGYTYRTTGDLASSYEQNGTHRWYVAAAGTAGNAISFTEAMRIANNGNVGIGTSSPNAAARLDVSSTTSGFLPPRMTTAQRDAIGSPPNGLMLYNTSTDKLQVRAAGSWVDLH